MHNHRLSPFRKGKRQVLLGTAGGCTKASTGYTFSRIQEQAQAILTSLKENGSPVYQRKHKRRFHFYDTLLLNIIKYRPDILPRIFLALFEQNPPEKVLKFLDEKTQLLEEAQIFLKLPWPPFFAAIYRECVQRGLYLFSRYRKAVGFPRFHFGFSKKLSRSS